MPTKLTAPLPSASWVTVAWWSRHGAAGQHGRPGQPVRLVLTHAQGGAWLPPPGVQDVHQAADHHLDRLAGVAGADVAGRSCLSRSPIATPQPCTAIRRFGAVGGLAGVSA